MAETPGTKFLEMRVLDRNGAGPLAQSSDGTGTDNHVAVYNNKVLTDGGPNLCCPVFIFVGKLLDGEQAAFAVPGNLPNGINFLAGLQYSSGYVKTNPVATVTLNIQKISGGIVYQIGTASISTAGVFTFASYLNNPQSLLSISGPNPDVLILAGPNPADANMADMTVTLYGTR